MKYNNLILNIYVIAQCIHMDGNLFLAKNCAVLSFIYSQKSSIKRTSPNNKWNLTMKYSTYKISYI